MENFQSQRRNQSLHILRNQMCKCQSLLRLWKWNSCRTSIRITKLRKKKRKTWMKLSFRTQRINLAIKEGFSRFQIEMKRETRNRALMPLWGTRLRTLGKCNSTLRQVAKSVKTTKKLDSRLSTLSHLSLKCSFLKKVTEGVK